MHSQLLSIAIIDNSDSQSVNSDSQRREAPTSPKKWNQTSNALCSWWLQSCFEAWFMHGLRMSWETQFFNRTIGKKSQKALRHVLWWRPILHFVPSTKTGQVPSIFVDRDQKQEVEKIWEQGLLAQGSGVYSSKLWPYVENWAKVGNETMKTS